MRNENRNSIGFKTVENELSKFYYAYDALNRLEYIYEAVTEAIDGEVCIVTRFVYDGVTQRVVLQKEYNGTWSSTYDVV